MFVAPRNEFRWTWIESCTAPPLVRFTIRPWNAPSPAFSLCGRGCRYPHPDQRCGAWLHVARSRRHSRFPRAGYAAASLTRRTHKEEKEKQTFASL